MRDPRYRYRRRRPDTRLPEADFSDPSWGRIDSDEWPIEVDIGEDRDQVVNKRAR